MVITRIEQRYHSAQRDDGKAGLADLKKVGLAFPSLYIDANLAVKGSSPIHAKTYGSVFSAMLTPQIAPHFLWVPWKRLGVGFCQQSRRVSES
jgi:hypothetical protein